MAVQAMKRGAVDFVEKPIDQAALTESILRALSADHDERGSDAERAGLTERLAQLTDRQRDVLKRIVSGRPNKVIAADLHLSPKTVEVHRSQLMKKLGVGSLAELVRLVLQHAPEFSEDADE